MIHAYLIIFFYVLIGEIAPTHNIVTLYLKILIRNISIKILMKNVKRYIYIYIYCGVQKFK